MTREEAAKILAAKYECMKREVSCTDLDCIYRACAECDLCYEQGTSGEQIEALEMAIKALEDLDPCEDAVSRNTIIQKLNTMDRYVSEELILCDTDKKFPKNEVFIVDDVYEEIVENLQSAQPEPCEDAVSREAVSSWLKQYGQDVLHGKYKFSLMYIWKNLMDLPSAQPKPHWIPVTERLPKDDVEVIVSCTDDSGDTSFSYTTVAWHFNGTWICDNERCFFITAWMPLPEPYRAERRTDGVDR